MSSLLVNLLTNPHHVLLIREKLPPAFQTAEDELKGNPAVGLLREQVILGMLIAFLGDSNVRIAESGVEADIDCYVDNQPLSIKTVTSSGGLRLKWTSNAVKAREFIQNYIPLSDLLVVRIVWGNSGSVRYIPLSSQQSTFQRLGERYLDYRPQTNTRGVNLSAEAEASLNRHPNSITLPMFWQRSETVVNPVDKWVRYWAESPAP
ncbi:MAG: hypothetical protein HW388_600 [Dehalococcoidia bacterium]|nr:hypothetical protein [Dehalococcoidia bacterium]